MTTFILAFLGFFSAIIVCALIEYVLNTLHIRTEQQKRLEKEARAYRESISEVGKDVGYY